MRLVSGRVCAGLHGVRASAAAQSQPTDSDAHGCARFRDAVTSRKSDLEDHQARAGARGRRPCPHAPVARRTGDIHEQRRHVGVYPKQREHRGVHFLPARRVGRRRQRLHLVRLAAVRAGFQLRRALGLLRMAAAARMAHHRVHRAAVHVARARLGHVGEQYEPEQSCNQRVGRAAEASRSCACGHGRSLAPRAPLGQRHGRYVCGL